MGMIDDFFIIDIWRLLWRFIATMDVFHEYCTDSEDVPIITKGDQQIVFVAFKDRSEAIRALQAVGQNEDFPELQVAPASRV